MSPLDITVGVVGNFLFLAALVALLLVTLVVAVGGGQHTPRDVASTTKTDKPTVPNDRSAERTGDLKSIIPYTRFGNDE